MSRSWLLALLALSLFACSAPPSSPVVDGGTISDGGTPTLRDERIADRAVVAFIGEDESGPWWIEERLEGQPIYVGDHDLGPRAIVRAAPERTVVWAPSSTERMTDAVLHASGDWSAIGVDASFGLFLARGDASGLRERIVLDDPELRADERAWNGEPPDALRVHSFSEASPSIVADGEDVVVALVTAEFAAIVYRWSWSGDHFVRGPRTLVSPTMAISPFLPIGGSYDDFDAVVSYYLLHLAIDDEGRAFVALFADQNRIRVQNAAFGTELDLIRDVLYPREGTSDTLVIGVDRAGEITFSTVVGTADVEDELFGIAVGDERLAVLGRSRRELGRDNTELHVMIAELDHEGHTLGTTTFDAEESGLAQTGLYDGDVLYVGGTEGWQQNPTGRSVFTPGHPFLLRLTGDEARDVERLDAWLPETSGAAELRALWRSHDRLLLGGHERGPLTHTGDGDRSLIRSDAYWAERAM